MAFPFTRVIRGLFGSRKDEADYFDPAYYRSTYADVRTAGVGLYEHYMRHGWLEGRNPSKNFNTLFYRDHHLGGAATNPLSHYVAAGGPSSGLRTMPESEASFVAVQRAVVADLFDPAYYRDQVHGRSLDLLGDYLTVGWREGLAPSADFDPKGYIESSQFVQALDVSPLYHYASKRRLRLKPELPRTPVETSSIPKKDVERTISTEFDADHYLRHNWDVKKAELDALLHFIDFGWREGRDPNALFDTRFYMRANRDIDFRSINPFYHYLVIGRAEGRRPNPAGTRLYPPMQAPSGAHWSAVTPAADLAAASVVVVMPVYKGLGETLASIHAVLSARQITPFALHVINDATPDRTLDAALTGLAAKKLFSYVRNKANLGFVKSCNKGLRAFADRDVVLLNADARVHGHWLDRLVGHARDPAVATITPLSNNATICSYPVLNRNNLVEPGMRSEALDAAAAVCNAGRSSELPTGVGFCFYMSRASRERIGILDEDVFRRGYGEENDFCLRAAKAGFRNILAEDIFVYHAGEVSFADFATEEFEAAQTALIYKHPDYLTRVRLHLDADPGRQGRMRLDLFRIAAATAPNCIVFVTHSRTGGIVTHIDHIEGRLRAAGTDVVHIRVGVDDAWSVEILPGSAIPVYTPNLGATSFAQIRPMLQDFLGWLKPRAFHIHSFVGLDWVQTKSLMDLIRDTGKPYYFTLHDYSVVCHRHHLVPTNGRYCGLPDVEVCRVCVATDRSYREALDPLERRDTFAAFLRGAAGVLAPSEDIKVRLEGVGASYPIIVRPHEETAPGAGRQVRRADAGARTIDIVAIGSLGDHKGSNVILDLARDARARSLPLRFHVVGDTNVTNDMLANGVTVSGKYAGESEAVALIQAIGPVAALLPSIWPETFCYALSMAFRLSLPPIVFDIGAQAERVRKAGYGFIMPYGLIDNPGDLNDRLILSLSGAERQQPITAPGATAYPDMLVDYYGLTSDAPGTHPRP